jgi:hypothetical protein
LTTKPAVPPSIAALTPMMIFTVDPLGMAVKTCVV